MAEEIFEELGRQYSISLVPSTGGVFEVTVGDQLVYSKRDTKRHAEYETDVAPHLRS